MTPWEKLEWLKANCNSVHVSVNDHRSYCETVAQSLDGRDGNLFDEDDAAVRAECIKRNEMSVVQCYPDTPIGFFRVGHYDLGVAIERVYRAIVDERAQRPAAAQPAEKKP